MKFFLPMTVVIFLLAPAPDGAAGPVRIVAHEPSLAAPAFIATPRIQQVGLTVSDLSRAVAFYRTTLGLHLLMETNGMAFFDLGGTRLMLGTDTDRPDVSRPTAIVYFDTADFYASVATLKQRGVSFVAPIETVARTATGTLMLAEFRDPDGNALAVMGEVPHPQGGETP